MVKYRQLWISLILIFCFFTPVSGQVKISGQLQSSIYSWEQMNGESNLDYYQGFLFRVSPKNNSNLYFSTFFRLAHRNNQGGWDDKAYNMYVDWKNSQNRFNIRIGRQFIYHGVMNGTIDGALFSAKLTKKLNLKLVGGLEAAQNREFGIRKWNEGNVLGSLLSFRFIPNAKIDLSYFQKVREKQAVWQLGGLAINGKLKNSIYYQTKLDYNLKTSEIQTMRYRLSYYIQKWNFSAEFNSQKPRIYEDSFFKIFDVDAYNQFRLGAQYQLNKYQIGFLYYLTAYENDNNNQVHFTIGSNTGLIGILYQDGFGGENLGFYGEILYPLLSNLSIRLFSSYYNYQRHTLDISEEATAFSGGLQYRLKDLFIIKAELQQSINSYFKNDLRGLFKINYLINYR